MGPTATVSRLLGPIVSLDAAAAARYWQIISRNAAACTRDPATTLLVSSVAYMNAAVVAVAVSRCKTDRRARQRRAEVSRGEVRQEKSVSLN